MLQAINGRGFLMLHSFLNLHIIKRKTNLTIYRLHFLNILPGKQIKVLADTTRQMLLVTAYIVYGNVLPMIKDSKQKL